MFKNNALFTILFNNDGLSLHGFKALLYSLPFTLGIALRCKEGLLTSVPQASPSVLRRCAKRCFAFLQPTSSIAFGLAAMCEASLHFITWLLRAQPFVLLYPPKTTLSNYIPNPRNGSFLSSLSFSNFFTVKVN